jgi:hypothetical protein
MHKFRFSLLLASASLSFLCFACGTSAQDAAKADTAATGGLSGRWVANVDFFGSPIYFGLLLEQQDEKLTGNFAGDKLEGTASGGRVHFLAKDEHGGTEEGNATVSGGTMTGSVMFMDSSDPRKNTRSQRRGWQHFARAQQSATNLCLPRSTGDFPRKIKRC